MNKMPFHSFMLTSLFIIYSVRNIFVYDFLSYILKTIMLLHPSFMRLHHVYKYRSIWHKHEQRRTQYRKTSWYISLTFEKRKYKGVLHLLSQRFLTESKHIREGKWREIRIICAYLAVYHGWMVGVSRAESELKEKSFGWRGDNGTSKKYPQYYVAFIRACLCVSMVKECIPV